MIRIIPENQLITPADARRNLKAVYGDTLGFSITLVDLPQTGDEYLAVLDYERVVFPVGREVCGTAEGTLEGGLLTFSMSLATARMQKWTSTLLRPEPICLQVMRIRDGVQTTLLLDTILAIPSVAEGNEIVQEGDPLNDLLDGKLDKPEAPGETGDAAVLGSDGKTVWAKPWTTSIETAVSSHNDSSSAHSTLFGGKMSVPETAGEAGDGLMLDSNGHNTWGKPWQTPISSGISAHNADPSAHSTLFGGKMDAPSTSGQTDDALTLGSDGKGAWGKPWNTPISSAVSAHNADSSAHSVLFGGKMDNPDGTGTTGDALTLGSDGKGVWATPWGTPISSGIAAHNADSSAHSTLFGGKMNVPSGTPEEGDVPLVGSSGAVSWQSLNARIEAVLSSYDGDNTEY